jgi:chemotaxis family two-component system response regulator Rcp1
MSPSVAIEILLVEDNAGDIRLTMEAFKESRLATHVSVVRDGEEALAFLRKEGAYACAPRPALMLLDLNMPKKDGREVLREVKGDPKLQSIPIIILTTSPDPADVANSYGLRADWCIQKPAGYDEFLALIHQLDSHWFNIVKVPSTAKEATE